MASPETRLEAGGNDHQSQEGSGVQEHPDSKWKDCYQKVPEAARRIRPKPSYDTKAEFEKDIVAQLNGQNFRWPYVKQEKLSHVKLYMRRRIRLHIEESGKYNIDIKEISGPKTATQTATKDGPSSNVVKNFTPRPLVLSNNLLISKSSSGKAINTPTLIRSQLPSTKVNIPGSRLNSVITIPGTDGNRRIVDLQGAATSKDVVVPGVQVLATPPAVPHSTLGRSITLSTGSISSDAIGELGEARDRQGAATSKDAVAPGAKPGAKPVASGTARIRLVISRLPSPSSAVHESNSKPGGSTSKSRWAPMQRAVKSKSKPLNFEAAQLPSDSSISLFSDSNSTSEDGNFDECSICNKGGKLICCEGCPNAYHARCLKQPVPKGSFYCAGCKAKNGGKSNKLLKRKPLRKEAESKKRLKRKHPRVASPLEDIVEDLPAVEDFPAVEDLPAVEDFPAVEEASVGGEPGDDDSGAEDRESTSDTVAFRKLLPLYPAGTITLFRHWRFDIVDGNDAGTISASWDGFFSFADMYKRASVAVQSRRSKTSWNKICQGGAHRVGPVGDILIPLARAEEVAAELKLTQLLKPLFYIVHRTMESGKDLDFVCSLCELDCTCPKHLSRHLVRRHSAGTQGSICMCGRGFAEFAAHAQHLQNCADYREFEAQAHAD